MVLLSVNSIKGRREYMEDCYEYIKKDNIIIAMVCDGHGGSDVSNKTCKQLPNLLLKALQNTTGTNVNNATSIRNVIKFWGEKMSVEKSGSTLTGVAIKDDTVYIYNLGDSRTFLELLPSSFIYKLQPVFNNVGNFVDKIYIDFHRSNFYCTHDHDAKCMLENKRIVSCGGFLSADNRLNGILSVTRALGDADITPGISYIPDVAWVKKSAIVGPIMMYSDGIYELQRYQTGTNFTDKHLYSLAKSTDAKTIVDYVYENGSEDNLTVLLIDTN